METAVGPVQNNGRDVRRRWNAERKLAVLQEWKNGVPLEEVCRKYAENAVQMYRWKRSLDQGRKDLGEMVPHSASEMQLPAEFHTEWIVKNKKACPQLGGAVQS